MKESISSGKELRKAIKKTVKTVAGAVKSTLGPSGTNVGVLSPIRLPLVVNDGVTVVKSFKFNDPLKKYIYDLFKTISQNTDNLAGDGTSTASTLAESIILEGIKHIEAEFSQVDIAKGIRAATLLVLEELEKKKISVMEDKKMLLHVSSISANNDKVLGKIISDAFLKVGVNGQIEVKDSLTDKTYIDVVNGMRYDSGFESNMFINTDKSEVILEDCNILLFKGKLKTLDTVHQVLQDMRNSNQSVLIVADDYDPILIEDLANVKVQNKVKLCAVKSYGFGADREDNIEDIAIITKSKVFSNKIPVTTADLGKASTVKVNSDSFTIVADKKDKKKIDKRISDLKIKAKKVSNSEKEELLDRIARLSNGVAVMYVSGNSPVEIAEKKYRIEDAINATRAALEEGIVPGGGITLLKISKSLKMPEMENKDQEVGFNILVRALSAPIKTICKNTGVSGKVVINEIMRKSDFNYGYDARLKSYKDLVKGGVIDPLKVTKAALTNASSVSQMLLTMNTAIY